MLVLTRLVNEEIRIGPDIMIKVCGLKYMDGHPIRGKVLIGITAPREMNIVRVEADDGRARTQDKAP